MTETHRKGRSEKRKKSMNEGGMVRKYRGGARWKFQGSKNRAIRRHEGEMKKDEIKEKVGRSNGGRMGD